MKFLGLQLFLTTTTVFTIATFALPNPNTKADKAAKASKGSKTPKGGKSPKGRDTECDFIPMIVSEPTQSDRYIDGDSESGMGGMWMWQNNFICPSALGDCTDSTKIGTASGTCLTFEDGNCDSVEYLTFSDGSNLYMRGMGPMLGGEAVVIGGTKCFYGARGTVSGAWFPPKNENLEYWTYDLTKVTMD